MEPQATNPLTTVVNYWPKQPPLILGQMRERDRKIGTKSVYCLSEILKQIPESDFLPSTRECKDDLAKLQWNLKHILHALRSATADDYRNSQWCQLTSRSWIPCDAYVVKNQKTGDSEPKTVNVYIKFGLSKQTGKAVLIVSCHESDEEAI